MCIPAENILLRILLLLNHSHVIAFGIICFYFSFQFIHVNEPQSHPFCSIALKGIWERPSPFNPKNRRRSTWKNTCRSLVFQSFKDQFDKSTIINQRGMYAVNHYSLQFIDSDAEVVTQTETRDSLVYFDI